MKCALSVILSCLLAASASAWEPPSSASDVAADIPECVPHSRALEKIGEVACVTGKVVGVHTTKTGVTYLNFCRDYRDCDFSVVVLAGDARRLGDLRVLGGREIRITGKVTGKGRSAAEMRWQKPEQLQVAVDKDKAARKR